MNSNKLKWALALALIANATLLVVVGISVRALLLGLDFLVDCLHGAKNFLDIADSRYAIITALNVATPIGALAGAVGIIASNQLQGVWQKSITLANTYLWAVTGIILTVFGQWYIAKLLDGESLRKMIWWL